MSQGDLLSLVDSQGYKLAKLLLMQCYSGNNGDFSVTYTYSMLISSLEQDFHLKKINQETYDYWMKMSQSEFMEEQYRRYVNYYKELAEKNKQYGLRFISAQCNHDSIIINMYCQWGLEWKTRVVNEANTILYQNWNVATFDIP